MGRPRPRRCGARLLGGGPYISWSGGRAGPRGLLHPQQLRGPVAVVAAGLAVRHSGARVGLGEEFMLSEFSRILSFLSSSCFVWGLAVRLPLPIFPFLGYLEYA